MLAVARYAEDYIHECQSRMEAQLAAYDLLAFSASDEALASFEPFFFANLALTLDASFVHRTRAIEGKDGSPLNGVRMPCNSILRDSGVPAADKTIEYKPESPVVKLEIGDEIRFEAAKFRALSDAVGGEIERRFV